MKKVIYKIGNPVETDTVALWALSYAAHKGDKTELWERLEKLIGKEATIAVKLKT